MDLLFEETHHKSYYPGKNLALSISFDSGPQLIKSDYFKRMRYFLLNLSDIGGGAGTRASL